MVKMVSLSGVFHNDGQLISPTSTIFTVLVIGSAILLALIYSYILKPAFFSEIAKIPAAHWSAHFSTRWMSLRRREGRESRSIFEAHQRKGDVVRLGPDEVSVMSQDGLRKIYGGSFSRTEWFDEFMNYDGTRNLVTLYHKGEHAARRRMVSNVFSKSFIQRSLDFQSLSSVILFERLLPVLREAARERKGVDVFPLVCALGSEFMTAYEFGVQNGYDLVSLGREEAMNAYIETGKLKLRGTGGPQKAKVAAKELEDQCMTMIEMTREMLQHGYADDEAHEIKKEKRTNPVTFANLSNQVFEKEGSLNMRDALRIIASEMLDNIEAAREGIGLTLTYMMHELSQDVNTQSALHEELRTIFPVSEEGTTPGLDAEMLRGLDKLPLLDAVFNETLRLRAPAPGPQRRRVPPEGTTIDGHFIPAGVTVFAAPYCIHRTPKAFPDAEVWRPNRWLNGSDDAEKGMNGSPDKRTNLRAHLFAFSSGSRTCMGNNFVNLGEFLCPESY